MPRSKNRNRNYARGLSNRQRGIFKKSNTFYRFYGGEIAVVIKQGSRITTYESRSGFLSDTSILFPDEAFGPDDFDTVADRQSPLALDSAVPFAMTMPPLDFDGFPGSISTGSPISHASGSRFSLPSDPPVTASSSSPSVASLGPPHIQPPDHSSPDRSEQDLDTVFGVTQEYIFPSSLLPIRGDKEQEQGCDTSMLPCNLSSLEHQPSDLLSPKPVSPQHQENIFALIDTYFNQ